MRATKDDVYSLSTCETVPSTRARNQTKRVRLEHGEDSDEVDRFKSPLTGKHEAPQTSSIASMCSDDSSDDSSDDILLKSPRRRLSARIVDDAPRENSRELAAARHAADLQEDLEDLRENRMFKTS